MDKYYKTMNAEEFIKKWTDNRYICSKSAPNFKRDFNDVLNQYRAEVCRGVWFEGMQQGHLHAHNTHERINAEREDRHPELKETITVEQYLNQLKG